MFDLYSEIEEKNQLVLQQAFKNNYSKNHPVFGHVSN